MATMRCEREDHMIAYRNMRWAGSNLLDDSRRLVTRHERQFRRPVADHHVPVAHAHAARLHPHARLARPRRLLIKVEDLQRFRDFGEDGSLHILFPTDPRFSGGSLTLLPQSIQPDDLAAVRDLLAPLPQFFGEDGSLHILFPTDPRFSGGSLTLLPQSIQPDDLAAVRDLLAPLPQFFEEFRLHFALVVFTGRHQQEIIMLGQYDEPLPRRRHDRLNRRIHLNAPSDRSLFGGRSLKPRSHPGEFRI